MRISDWSSDLCSSDLPPCARQPRALDDIEPDAAAPDHRDAITRLHFGDVDHRSDARHHRTAQDTRALGREVGGAGRHRFGADERVARKGAEMERALDRSEEHTSELQSLMRISYAVFCLKKNKKKSKN